MSDSPATEKKDIRRSTKAVLLAVRAMDARFFSRVSHVFDMGPAFLRLHIPNERGNILPAYNIDVKHDREKDKYQVQAHKMLALGMLSSRLSPWVNKENVGTAIRKSYKDIRRRRFGHDRVAIRIRGGRRRLLK